MLVFLLFFLGDTCILPVCSGSPFKHPFSNLSLCFCLSKKKKSRFLLISMMELAYHLPASVTMNN